MKKLFLTCLFILTAQNVYSACDNKTLTGDFRLSALGGDNGSSCGALGIATFDGKQTMSVTGIVGCGGDIGPMLGKYTYTVLANCMGTAKNNETGLTYYFLTDKKMQKGSIFSSGSGGLLFGSMEKHI